MRFVTCLGPDGVEEPAVLSADGTAVTPLRALRSGKVNIHIKVIVICNFQISDFPVLLISQMDCSRIV